MKSEGEADLGRPLPLAGEGGLKLQERAAAGRDVRDHFVTLPLNGGRFRVRPVRAQDKPAVMALLQQLTPEEIRLRFFCCMRYFSDELLERLTHLANIRRLGLVAMPAEEPERIVASALLVPAVDGVEAEFAALVHHDYARHGLGRHLIECLVEHARQRGVRLVYGMVLADNETMLQLAGEMGFVRKLDPHDPGVVRIELPIDA